MKKHIAALLLALVATIIPARPALADFGISNVGPSAASGEQAITWDVTDPGDAQVDVWYRYLPDSCSCGWTLLGSFPASSGTTGEITVDLGSDGMRHDLWVGGNGIAAATVNQAPGTPSISVDTPDPGAQPVTWTAAGLRGSAEAWVQPRDEYGNPQSWVYIGTYNVESGTTSPDTFEFCSGIAYELWVGANGYQVVGDVIVTP